jgi:glycerol-3-phosphate dehydrogenase
MTSPQLSSANRIAALADMSGSEVDILVIGGGVVGAGSALDAATRGLRVAIVEERDWASGTSSRSSKLIHGGLRYLEMLDFRLVFEALRERGLLLSTIAPHLVRPVQFLYPLTHRVWERAYIGAGIMLYDLLAFFGGNFTGLAWHRHLSRKGTRREIPGLAPRALVGAIRYSDAQIDDARHTMTVVRTAASLGALAANRTRVASLIIEDEAVRGALLVDQETGARYEVRAKRVIDAGGVWTDDLQALAGVTTGLHVQASKGVHIVIDRSRIAGTSGLILRAEKSVLFVIPWGSHWIIGTTDTPWTLDKAHPAASAKDIQYVLDHVNPVLDNPLGLDDIIGVYAGLRPLLAGTTEETSKLSREHHVGHPMKNLVVIAGGKYTTYRVMGEDAVDAALEDWPGGASPSKSREQPLLGAEGFARLWDERATIAVRESLPTATIEHLLHRYGSAVTDLFDLMSSDARLAEPLPSGTEYLAAEAVYAVTHEGALHLDDVLARRTRLSIESVDRGVDSAETVAALIAPYLGWQDSDIAREVDVYERRVAAERSAQTQLDDETSEIARLAAPETVPER